MSIQGGLIEESSNLCAFCLMEGEAEAGQPMKLRFPIVPYFCVAREPLNSTHIIFIGQNRHL